MKKLRFKSFTKKNKSTLFEFHDSRKKILLHNTTFSIDFESKKIILSKSDWMSILKML